MSLRASRSRRILVSLVPLLLACGSGPGAGEADQPVEAGVSAPVECVTAAEALTHPPMQKLRFLVGEWRGAGSVRLGPGEPHRFTQTETVASRLDGVVVMIEGIGKAVDGDEIVHHAFGVLFFDAAQSAYKMRSFTRDGKTIESDVVVGDATLGWGYDLGSRRTRYSIQVTPEGTWSESGESSADGTTWQPFFEMKLDRLR